MVETLRIKTPEGAIDLALEEWMQLDIDTKVEYLRHGEIEFRKADEVIPVRDALDSLRQKRG